jgi:Ca-activated chloride channel family protein
MRHILALLLVLAFSQTGSAAGLLIPKEKNVPPLAMLNHHVNTTIEDQVAVTKVEQTFRNHTDRVLEATYVFPIPKGASVRKFSMWVSGKELPGELVEAAKARAIYQDIIQRSQDPGFLEYMGNNLLRLKIAKVPAKGDQKIMISYTSVAVAENGIVEYIYPLKTNGKATSTLEKFSVNIELNSQHPLQNIYSPTHAITITRPNDRKALIGFEKDQALLDKDFQLFYHGGGKDVGLTMLSHRPVSTANGYFMLLLSPRAELPRDQQVPRDMVFVLDTSGSMRGKRMTQARGALNYCLKNLAPQDRFAVINFATTVNKYNDQLLAASAEQVTHARKWVDGLEATGGTAINDGLAAALDMRTNDDARTFTIVFFTDGRPTIGETNSDKILQNVKGRNNASTRIFTFGVGDDVNATMLDQIADQSRALSTYVRETEDIEAKVSGLYAKISNPVLTNLKLEVGNGVRLSEVYPPHLPDLFHGTQLVVLGRYSGTGHAAVKLIGNMGKNGKEFVHEVNFADRTTDDKAFVEDLWARRKVGYLLDQIRLNGEKKELVEEVVTLAKRYGITTPYTSYLIVPDGPIPVAGRSAASSTSTHGKPNVSFGLGGYSNNPYYVPSYGGTGYGPPALQTAPGKAPIPVTDFLKQSKNKEGAAGARHAYADAETKKILGDAKDAKGDKTIITLQEARDRWNVYNQAKIALKKGAKDEVQSGKLGVELSCDSNNLRAQTRLTQTATRWIGTRNCMEVGGVWIDEAFDAKMNVVTVKAMSEAYFRILEKNPNVRDVFRLGNHLVWVTPSGTALVLDTSTGLERMPDADIDRLFTAPKKNDK